MKLLSLSLSALVFAFILPACDHALDLGDPQDGGIGGAPGTGGVVLGSGGVIPGTGGIWGAGGQILGTGGDFGSGGAMWGAGGASWGAGGAGWGAGGDFGSGGAMWGAGGNIWGAGGAPGSGGYIWGAGGAPGSGGNIWGAGGAPGSGGNIWWGSGGTGSGGHYTGAGGANVGAQNGMPCQGAADCASGHCSQNICCNADCSGTCRSCSIPGAIGSCINVPYGQDPLGQCSVAPSCSGSKFTPATTCNGLGACAGQVECAPFGCTASGCRTSCQTSNDCAAGHTCVGGVCASSTPAPVGSPCTSATGCMSGFCVDGVCCNTACAGTCQSCSLAGSVGTCAVVPAGQDPRNDCPDTGPVSCGPDGTCNGSGSCRKYPSGTVCAARRCTGSTLTQASVCDGAGICQPGPALSCAPFNCSSSSNSCPVSCTVSSECSTALCVGGTCGLKPLGNACASAGECTSGNCAQGVCCDTACSSVCSSCNLPGTVGICSLTGCGD